MQGLTNRNSFYKSAMALTFLLLSIATFIAYQTPATGYEIDIYGSTPGAFWVSISISLLISVGVAVSRFAHSKQNKLSLGAAVFSVILIVALPLIRGYHHVGEGDMMTHIGWTEELLAGTITPLDLFYPSLHTLIAMLSLLTNLQVTQLYLLFSPVLVCLFIIFTALSAQLIETRQGIMTIGVFVGLLLLPINQVATHLQPSPRNASVYLLPVILFVVVYLMNNQSKRSFVLAGITLFGYLFIHPQFGVTISLMLGAGILSLGILQQLYVSEANHSNESVLILTLVVGLVLWIMIANEEVFTGFVQQIIHFLLVGAETGGEISDRASSLSAVGGGIIELGIKIFLLPLVACAIVMFKGLFVTSNLFRKPKPHKKEDVSYLFLLVGILPLIGLLVLFLVTNRRDYLFRYQGFMMALVTILTVIPVFQILADFSKRKKQLLIPIIIACLTLSLLVAFPSPYIYNDSDHVTEAQMSGYETMFEHADPKINTYDHVRSSASRYGNAILGPNYLPRNEYYSDDRFRGGTPDHFNNHNLAGFYDEPTYLAVTTADKKRDVGLYAGFRFNRDDFRYLDQDPNIQKVHANGGTEFYYVTQD